ncbi:MAG: hypothetical protein Q9223_002297 [Gallowayella weberi]
MPYYFDGIPIYSPYVVDYPLIPYPANCNPPRLNRDSHYDSYYDSASSSDEVYNTHPYPTHGRPLGRIHRAAEAEGITLRHIPGCHQNGRCERAHKAGMRAELRRLGIDARRLTVRQVLRVVRGLPAGAPDQTPSRAGGAGLQGASSGQQQQQIAGPLAGSAMGGPSLPAGGNASAGAMVQHGAGGGWSSEMMAGQPNGMMGSGGFAGNHYEGMHGARGGMSGGGHGGMDGMNGGVRGGFSHGGSRG